MGKRPRAVEVDGAEPGRRRLVWRFGEIDDEGSWALSRIGRERLKVLLGHLRSFESMTVNEVFAPNSEHGKRYRVEDLPKAASDRLVEIGRDDETEIARLRCGGKPRLYGFLRENVFHVLWWDPQHAVWPTRKRNT